MNENLHDSDDPLYIFLSEFTCPLSKGDVGLLQDDVSVPEQPIIVSVITFL